MLFESICLILHSKVRLVIYKPYRCEPMEMLLLKIISRLEYYKLPQYCGLKDRRQFMCFLITSLAEMLFIPANFLGLNDYLEPQVFDVLNWFQLLFLIVLQVAFWRNWLSIRTALYVFFIEISLKISFESLFQAVCEGGGIPSWAISPLSSSSPRLPWR